jgi:hypothetical protein
MYVGSGANENKVESEVGRYRVNTDSQEYVFDKKVDTDPDFLTDVKYDPVSGWLKVTLNLEKYGCDPKDPTKNCEFQNDAQNFCKPVSYCSWEKRNGSGNESCGCRAGVPSCKDDSICAWGPSDIDCPTKGCFGFSFKIQPEFDTNPRPGPPPAVAFPNDSYWNVDYKRVTERISGPECDYNKQP